MSAGYGYVRIQFTKEDGTVDVETARKAFRYCTEHFDFFNTDDGRFQEEASADENVEWGDDWKNAGYGDAFQLDEKCGEIAPAYIGDGIDIKHSCSEVVEENWVQEVYQELKPYQMKVQFHEDFSETSYDMNTIKRYKVVEDDGQRKLVLCDHFNFTNGTYFEVEEFYCCNDEFDNYDFLDDYGDYCL